MERRDFLKLTVGFVAGASALAASAQAAPLPPIPAAKSFPPTPVEGAEPAVASQDDIDSLAPEQVRYGWRRRRFFGFRRRRFYGFRRRRFYGFRRRRFWRRRFW